MTTKERDLIGRRGGFFKTPDASGDTLAVLIHAYRSTPAHLNRVAAAIREAHPQTDILAPRLPTRIFSLADPENVARDLVRIIGEQIKARQAVEGTGGKGYGGIVLVGHSSGAVLARKVVALAYGATPQGEVDPKRAEAWCGQIRRVVLLAAISRGWTVSSAQRPGLRLAWTCGVAIGNLCHYLTLKQKDLYIFGFRRGAPFLITTRLQSQAVARTLTSPAGPTTVQLLGSYDDLVAPTDNIDMATGSSFFYREVAKATHDDIITLDQGKGGRKAWEAFIWALKSDCVALAKSSLSFNLVFDLYDEGPDDHDSALAPRPSVLVRNVVFVIHGIRDRGFWTRRIALAVKTLAPFDRPCRSVTSTYGYFPMGLFLLPWVRQAKVEWFLDQYVTAKALYPGADNFAFIGHSNGTYLLAKALELCPAVHFNSVIFTGSVVRRSYDWRRCLPGPDGTGQVTRMVNYVATRDWVVGLFPKGLAWLDFFFDLGGAGHNGFEQAVNRVGPLDPLAGAPLEDGEFLNLKYVRGGHSAALSETYWNEMAAFALGGDDPPLGSRTVEKRSPLFALFAAFSGLVWVVILTAVLGIGGLILAPLGLPVPVPLLSLLAWFGFADVPRPGVAGALFASWNWAADTPGWVLALLFLAYFHLVRLILQKA